MYLLDTVAVSDTSKTDMHAGMQRFLSVSDPDTLYISVVSIGELRFGWAALPFGNRRSSLQEWVEQTEAAFDSRVLSVDANIARVWGDLRAKTRKDGFTIALPDLLIAATALQHDLMVVTRNIRDFEPTGCQIHNPWANLDV